MHGTQDESAPAHAAVSIIRLSRRGVLAGAGGAALLALSPFVLPGARGALVAADDPRVLSKRVSFEGPSGPTGGYLALPNTQLNALPIVLILHGEGGMTPAVEAITRHVSLSLVVAFAPDLTGAGAAVSDLVPDVDSRPGGPLETALAALDFIADYPAGNRQVGAIGFGSGGALVTRMATTDRLLAGAIFDSVPTPDVVAAIRTPLLLVAAGNEIDAAQAYAASRAGAPFATETMLHPDQVPGFVGAAGEDRSEANAAAQEATARALDRATRFLTSTLGFG